MSIENRFDRWMNERDGPREVRGKSYDDYKEALMGTRNNWFVSEKGRKIVFGTAIKLFYIVAEKWLDGALRDLGDGTYKSRVHPFIRQWGTAPWNLSATHLYELAKNYSSDLMYIRYGSRG